MTFEEIYARMAAAYEAESGMDPADASDAGIRLKVLAGEIYTAMCMLDGVRREAFPQTAEGRALELHAGERGLERKPAVRASGVLRFSRELPLDYDVEIPAGTVCASSGAAVEFETTEAVILPAGQTEADAPACAAVGGKSGNAAAGRIDTLVTPPVGIETVTNPEPFTGGTDAETDDALRRRLLQGYSVLPNGTNAEMYRRAALAVPGVSMAKACAVADEPNAVEVYVFGNGDIASFETLQDVEEQIERMRVINANVTVSYAIPHPHALTVYISPKPNCTFAEAEVSCRTALLAVFERLEIGEPLPLAACTAAIMDTGTIENCRWGSAMTDIAALPHEVVMPGVITILEAE